MSQTRWFREALEVYYQMMEAPASQQEGLHAIYWTLVDSAATTGKFSPNDLHRAIIERAPAYRHARLEGFGPEKAFQIAAKA